jgi:hypothetical protein
MNIRIGRISKEKKDDDILWEVVRAIVQDNADKE